MAPGVACLMTASSLGVSDRALAGTGLVAGLDVAVAVGAGVEVGATVDVGAAVEVGPTVDVGVTAGGDVPVVAEKGKPETAVFRFNWLSTTGTGILFAAILSACWMGVSPGRFIGTFVETAHRMRWPTCADKVPVARPAACGMPR